MIKALLSGQISAFERTWRYDGRYMRDLLAASPWTLIRFGMVSGMTPRRDAPAAALVAASLVATLSEDCGACTQIVVDMAARRGVAPTTLRAILAGDRAAMGADAELGYDFARSVLARDLEESDRVRAEILKRWGQKALVALSLALTTARLYPTVKYALGYGRACSRIEVAGQAAPLARPLTATA